MLLTNNDDILREGFKTAASLHEKGVHDAGISSGAYFGEEQGFIKGLAFGLGLPFEEIWEAYVADRERLL